MEAIIDGSLDARYKPKSVRMIVDLVIRCVRPQGTQRPSSSDVVRDIEEAVHEPNEAYVKSRSWSDRAPGHGSGSLFPFVPTSEPPTLLLPLTSPRP